MAFNPFVTLGRTPVGLPRHQLVPGAVVTISANLRDGNDAYTQFFWEVVSTNAGHVMLRQLFDADRTLYLVLIHEHEFYAAEHLLDVFHKFKNEEQPTSTPNSPSVN